MDKSIEEVIARTFFSKRLQKRVLFELASEKKRKTAIGRLSHNYFEVMDMKYVVEIPKPNSDPKVIEKILKEYGAGGSCYVISYNDEIDGKNLDLSYALEKVVGFGMPSLIFCNPNKVAYLECEQVEGSPPRYVLKRD